MIKILLWNYVMPYERVFQVSLRTNDIRLIPNDICSQPNINPVISERHPTRPECRSGRTEHDSESAEREPPFAA